MKDVAIPVLMYHHVNPEGDFINVRPELFEKHIRYLREHGFNALHTADLLSVLRRESAAPEKPFMITFDDGWLDNWVFAFPILKKYGMKAVVFAVTALVADGKKRRRSDQGSVDSLPRHRECQRIIDEGRSSEVMMNWEELKVMDSTGLIDVQSHTHSHQRCDRLGENTAQESALKDELETSRALLQEKLNRDRNALCWPWGRYSEGALSRATEAGYKLLFTTRKGTNTVGGDPLRIRRIVIGNISTFSLAKKLFIHSRAGLSEAYLKYFK